MAKSKKRSTVTSADRQLDRSSLVIAVTKAVLTLALAALASPVSQANLSPVYGSIPSSIYHGKGILFSGLSVFLAFNSPTRTKSAPWLGICLAVFAYCIPVIQFYLFPFSEALGAKKGPLVTESLTFYPLLILAFTVVANTLLNSSASTGTPLIDRGIYPALSYSLFSVLENSISKELPTFIGKADFMTRSGLNLLIGSAYAGLARSPYLLIGVPAMLHTMFANPHHYSVQTNKVLNSTLAIHNYTLLERRDSLTGYISVIEDNDLGFRVLRCDHSLLGGEWLVNEERAAQGQKIKETIYSVFTMLESVRLVDGRDPDIQDSETSALFIGLGIGTSPKAFMTHGINTTIVELDPVVHEFATKYFDLPGGHTACLEDAIEFVEVRSQEQPESYDYIVHDVFTGGAEPTALFTFEFLQGLKSLLKADGVVAINYAGDINMPPPRIVLATIHAVFPTCRIYRDSLEDLSDPNNSFVNMVVFCIKSDDRNLTFRQPVTSDWLDSLSRRDFVPPPPNLEIKFADVVGEDMGASLELLRKGNEDIIERYHTEAAVRHWNIMRTVLPSAIWQTW